MKFYNLTIDENKFISAIINDLTKPYHAHSMTEFYEQCANEGINKVRQRAYSRGLLLDEADWTIPTRDLRAIVKEDNG